MRPPLRRSIHPILHLLRVVALFLVIGNAGCGDNIKLVGEKAITQFSINGVAGTISGSNISLTLPFGTDRTNLTPTISHSGISIDPASGVAQDFTGPVLYTVTGEDGTTAAYTATVNIGPSNAKALTAFSFEAADNAGLTNDVVATVNGTTVSATVPFGTNVTALVATYTTTGASVTVGGTTQASGTTANNFTSTVAYTVVAADGSTQVFNVTVEIALANAKELGPFSFLDADNADLTADVTATIVGTTITATVPFDTDVTALVATFSTSGASVRVGSTTQFSGTTPNDFTNTVQYTVVAANGSTQVYDVIVTVALSTAKELGPFQFFTTNNPDLTANVTATFSGTVITATVPFGSDITALVATFSTTGASVRIGSVLQETNMTVNDFTNMLTYTVVAADGSTQDYTVIVINSASGDKDITKLTINGVPGLVDGTNIGVTLPFGSAVTALVPIIEISGDRVDPASGSPRNFTAPVLYTVTAADNTTKVYTVTVTVAGNSAKDITLFRINGLDAQVFSTSATTGTITLNMPNGTNLTSLTPQVTITGISVNPDSGVPTDFSDPVDYVVTAADGSTKTYTVTLGTVNGNGTALISSFTILGVSGSINNGSSSSVTIVLPAGTNLDGQTPIIVINASSISPPSGVPRDFTQPVLYTVTAANGSTRVYTVTVTTL